jgi:pimeloyl-ACP methyl ester carboxylesterase
MGPLTETGQQVAGANLLKPLSAAERQAFDDLRAERRIALAAEDWERHAQLHIEQVTRYNVRSWFHAPDHAARFAQDFAANYAYNPRIAPLLMPTVKAIDILDQLQGKSFPAQIVYGYQDFEPITQAYQVREVLPSTELCFINEAGHVPWYEQPDIFYTATRTFLSKHMVEVMS